MADVIHVGGVEYGVYVADVIHVGGVEYGGVVKR